MKRKSKPTNHNDVINAPEIKNSMAIYVLRYFLKQTEDEDIKSIVKSALHLSESITKDIKEIFTRESIPIPNGFTEKDVDLEAPRLFSDEFYLHYLKYTSKAGMSIYSIAIPLMMRRDVRNFYIKILDSTIKLVTEINEVATAKGIFVKPPIIPIPEKAEFVKQQSFLNGFFGDVRPLHALEVTHHYDNIENNITSKALLIGFSQVAKTEKVKKFFLRGEEITDKHIQSNAQQLNKNNLPAPPLIDHLVSTSTTPPFSEKLMLWHKIDMFSMKVRGYANGMSLNGRRDVGGMYVKSLMDVGLYLEDGANIMIDQGWMEQPPTTVDRVDLAKNKNGETPGR
jgi:hypothetical protein